MCIPSLPQPLKVNATEVTLAPTGRSRSISRYLYVGGPPSRGRTTASTPPPSTNVGCIPASSECASVPAYVRVYTVGADADDAEVTQPTAPVIEAAAKVIVGMRARWNRVMPKSSRDRGGLSIGAWAFCR